MRAFALFALASFLLASPARGQAAREFDWIPSGSIAVGDERSEAAARYWSDATAATRVELPYASGRKVAATAREVKLERFRVRIATYRGGPAPGALVIRRRWDTRQPAATLWLRIDDQKEQLAPWSIPQFKGDRRWVDVYYAIPIKALRTPDGKGMKSEVAVSVCNNPEFSPSGFTILPAPIDGTVGKGYIASPAGAWMEAFGAKAPDPTRSLLSAGYQFFITRDWEVLGDERLGAIARKEGADPTDAYLTGIAALGEADYEAAGAAFQKAAAEPKTELARLSRRMLRLVALRKAADALAVGGASLPRDEGFKAHYLFGLYAGANGFWEEALDEFQRAVACRPADPEATYHLAEAMEYNRLPVETYAPLFERAGALHNRPDTQVADVLVAINTRAVKGVCGELSLGSIEALFRDWRIVEQMTYGASRGAWKMRTTYRVWGPGSADWVMQAGWIFSPPDSEVPVRGTYDYSVCTAEYGSSHAGGVDCGVSGAGGAQIGPTRGWEVLLHEWNHEFDWVCIFGEQVPGFPVTHDSDGCGKQPIVNMGCGHRSAMRYYIVPAEYRRHEAAAPELVGNHIKLWGLAELTAPPEPPAKGGRLLDKLASPREAEMVAGPGAVAWKPIESKADFVGLLSEFPKAPEKCIAYAQTFIYSPKKQETRLWLGCNDTAALWLNGRKIHEGRYYACARWDDANRTDMVCSTAKLEQGWNRLLAKSERGGGKWGFSVGLTTFDNRPVEGLRYQNAAPPNLVPLYQPLKAGPHYKWAEVKDDYIELLPTLTEADLRKITGLAELTMKSDLFFLGIGAPHAGARAIAKPDPTDREVNNFLNWDAEAIAAIRFQRDGKPRDLLLIRPEYHDEYLELLKEADAGLPGSGPKDRILGTMAIQNPAYPSTPNRAGRRYVLAVEAFLGDYPLDEQDLLGVKERIAAK